MLDCLHVDGIYILKSSWFSLNTEQNEDKMPENAFVFTGIYSNMLEKKRGKEQVCSSDGVCEWVLCGCAPKAHQFK